MICSIVCLILNQECILIIPILLIRMAISTPVHSVYLLNINRWLIANKLTLNTIKTEFMLIDSRQKLNNLPSLPSLNINNVSMKHSHCLKPLGMLVDENLTWENHVDAISKKIMVCPLPLCMLSIGHLGVA